MVLESVWKPYINGLLFLEEKTQLKKLLVFLGSSQKWWHSTSHFSWGASEEKASSLWLIVTTACIMSFMQVKLYGRLMMLVMPCYLCLGLKQEEQEQSGKKMKGNSKFGKNPSPYPSLVGHRALLTMWCFNLLINMNHYFPVVMCWGFWGIHSATNCSSQRWEDRMVGELGIEGTWTVSGDCFTSWCPNMFQIYEIL